MRTLWAVSILALAVFWRSGAYAETIVDYSKLSPDPDQVAVKTRFILTTHGDFAGMILDKITLLSG
jgi:hypothetical protein